TPGEPTYHANSLVLSPEALAALVGMAQDTPVGQQMGAHAVRRNFQHMTLPPQQCMVVYLPDLGVTRTGSFCEALSSLSLSVLDISGVKSPSALKKALTPVPQVVVASHPYIQASPQCKAGKVHATLWRCLVKQRVAVRAFMCLEKDMDTDTEARLRGVYEGLAGYVLVNYSDKRGEGVQADTLQCIPLRSYFEEVWM
ncbi:hypothetical protein KIPB_015502, partial [Kipferlia bialata]